ncbi:MAG: polyphosphate kinase 1 [Deinococcota bacterium]
MAAVSLRDPQLYINRELSWLSFNAHVLEEAGDSRNPLLERLKFTAIFSSNLDEFMMIRYAGLKEQLAAGVVTPPADGMTPLAQLNAIAKKVHAQVLKQRRLLRSEVLPALEEHGVVIVPQGAWQAADISVLDDYFERELFPVLTPLGVDSGHPFPRLANLSFSLLLELCDIDDNVRRTAVVQIPSILPRFVRLPAQDNAQHRFALLEDIIQTRLEMLFPGHKLLRVYGFRVTRNADIDIAEDEADDLLQVIEDEVRKRRWRNPVRLEVMSNMPASWQAYLRDTLGLDGRDVYEIPNYLNASDFMQLAQLDIPDLRFKPFHMHMPSEYWGQTDIFAAIREQDILVHHPFHSFDAVLNLLEQAAEDPDVLAIKQTLYRVGRNSPVVAALAKAAGNGKLVTALVELKARFDEANNIVWARELERAGVHVVYGLVGLKTHCKTLLIVRREGDEIRRYVHLGTGNYNPSTSSLYTDMALLSCDPDITADTSEMLNYLTGFSKQQTWRKLWVAPKTLRTNLIAAIEREAGHAKTGTPARIIAKMNSLVDPEVIHALYRASKAGVQIDLIVRGICCLLPDVKNVSENIRVRAVVGRFLEHSRIFYFQNKGSDDIYLGSADWMQRNLNRRVEAVFPIEDGTLKRKVMNVLDLLLRDNEKARELRSDGSYRRVKRKSGQNRLNAQERLLELSTRRYDERL